MRSSEVAVRHRLQRPHYFSYLFKKNVGMNPRDYEIRAKGEKSKYSTFHRNIMPSHPQG